MTILSGPANAERVNEQLLALEACESERKKGKKLLRQVQTAKLEYVHVKTPEVYDALMTQVKEALDNIRAAYTKVNPDVSRFTKEPRIGKVVEGLDQVHKEAIVITSDGKDFLLSEDTVKLIGTIRELKKDSDLPGSSVISFSTISSDTMASILEYLKTGTVKIAAENFVSLFNAAEFLDLEKSPAKVDSLWLARSPTCLEFKKSALPLKELSIDFAKSMRLKDFTEDHCNQPGFSLLATSLFAERACTTEELDTVPPHLAKYISKVEFGYATSAENEIAKMEKLGIKPTSLIIKFERIKAGEMEPSIHALPDLLKALPQLSELVLADRSYRANINEELMVTLANFCPNLKKLTTTGCYFNTLLAGFPELRELEIQTNPHLTNEGLEPASLYPKLEKLVLSECSRVTDLLDPAREGRCYSTLRSFKANQTGITQERMGAIKEKYKLS